MNDATAKFSRSDRVSESEATIEARGIGFPPCNIERVDDIHRVVLAAPGYRADEVRVFIDDDVLVIEGNAPRLRTNAFVRHRELASAFRREFSLAPFTAIETVRFETGLLIVDLVRRVPPMTALDSLIAERAGAIAR